MNTRTPVKGLKVGDDVVVDGYENEGTRRITDLYDQRIIPGGVRLDRAIGPDSEFGLFRSWNEDVLTRVVWLDGDLVCDHVDPKQCSACRYLVEKLR